MEVTNQQIERYSKEGLEALRLERQAVIRKILQLIIHDMTEPEKGNLTTCYVIRLLEEAIGVLRRNASSRPAKDALILLSAETMNHTECDHQ